MSESLGARLRQQRERRQIDLDAIAEQTKIKRSLLEQLERDDVSHWPVGIFRRAFVRAYAQAIGLEPDIVVREFLGLYPDPMEVVAAVPGAAADGENALTGGRPPTRFGDLVRRFFPSRPSRPAAAAARESAEENESQVDGPPVRARAFELDLVAAARLCTELGRADKPGDIPAPLREAARVFDAIGIIVWAWDPRVKGLKPAWAHGYSDTVLAQLPTLRHDAHNATAAAFRTGRACTVTGSNDSSGALVLPLMTAVGCSGVLAIEFAPASEQEESRRAFATILAAQFARVITFRGCRPRHASAPESQTATS